MVSNTALELMPGGAALPQTPQHKRFRTLLERIEKARARLQAWQEGLPRFAQAHAAQIGPVMQRLDEARREWALELEQVLLAGRWSHAEKAVLERMILDIARALLGKTGGQDAELKALFNRLSDTDYDTEAARHLAAMKALLEERAGVDLADAEGTTVDELVRETQQRMAERARAEEAAEAERPTHRKPRTAAAKRAEAEASKASQSVRAVYRKLAALLHPDRAPADATDAQRQVRHEQMAQANAAYEAGDLLTLLTMQLRWEQVDLAQAAQVTDTQIQHFNKVLAQQLAEIDEEIRERETTFCSTYGYLPDRRPDPNKLNELLKDAMREALAAEATLAHDRRMLRSDPTGTRRLLKQLGQEQRQADILGGMF
jgi:hypothetical protein